VTVDLEAQVRAELAARAADAGVLPVTGAALRESARRRRIARLRAGAVAVAVVAVVTVGAAVLRDPSDDAAPAPVEQPSTTTTTAPTEPDPAWLQVPLSDDMVARVVTAAGGDDSTTPVVSAKVPGSDRVVVLLAGLPAADGSVWVASATLESDQPGAAAESGTSGQYPSYTSLIALPARDGDANLLVVLTPSGVGDTVEATSSVPGVSVRRTSVFADDRLALVPITAPESVTRVRVLRQGRAVVDTIPAGSLLGPAVPRTLERVVTSSAGPPSQPVQVRTDGSTACRLTVGSWWDGPAYITWNPFDSACAPVDGDFHLLLAADRRYSSVAGVAPSGTSVVRLTWRDGSATELPVAHDKVPAFIDSSGRAPVRLVRAEALDQRGQVLASAVP
jgi:hypothetical protein